MQRFWFVRAWRLIGGLSSANLRVSLRAALIALSLSLLATLFDPLLDHAVVHLHVGGFHFGKALETCVRIWLLASFFGLIAIECVALIEWMTNLAIAPRSDRQPLDGAFNASRRTFFRYASALAGATPFLAAAYGYAAGRLRYKVERVEVPVANLPAELEGLRIAQLSDIHIGDYMPPEEIARAVAMANDLRADISVVTGDFVSIKGDPLDACIAELAKLRAPLGVWGCNGNHEIYADMEDEAERLFAHHGMRLLRAANAVVEHNGGRFNLLGVDYQRDHMTNNEGGRTGPMLAEIEHLVRRDMPNVLLSHNPNSFQRAAELGIELSLAGHTHGGQVRLEIVDRGLSPARLISPFVAGLYRLPMSGVTGEAKLIARNWPRSM